VELDFETSVAGDRERFATLMDKPNISKTGLQKVTNDMSLFSSPPVSQKIQNLCGI
jgi:hypothetical protein